jgi:hypothetical protein
MNTPSLFAMARRQSRQSYRTEGVASQEASGKLTITWPESFDEELTYQNFESILEALKLQFDIRPLRDRFCHATARPTLFMRHDVDVSLKSALRLAEIESGLGVRATYMIIPNSPLYNIAGDAGRSALARLCDLGHEVALHFDISEHHRSNEVGIADIADQINLAGDAIEQITGVRVCSLSFHRPPREFLRGPETIYDKVNAYSKALITNYVSDSKGRWDSSWRQRLNKSPGAINQILIHPIWWGDVHLPPEQRLQQFFEDETLGEASQTAEAFARNLASTLPGVVRAHNRSAV